LIINYTIQSDLSYTSLSSTTPSLIRHFLSVPAKLNLKYTTEGPQERVVTSKSAQKGLDDLRLFIHQSNCDEINSLLNIVDDKFMKLRIYAYNNNRSKQKLQILHYEARDSQNIFFGH
jgi:hypothetical protein